MEGARKAINAARPEKQRASDQSSAYKLWGPYTTPLIFIESFLIDVCATYETITGLTINHNKIPDG